MANPFTPILSPLAEPAPQTTWQPPQKDDNKNNMATTSASAMAGDRATTAPPQEPHPAKEHEDEFRAKSLEYKTQLEQAKPSPSTSQLPTNNNISRSATPNAAPFDPRDANATIQALRQQLWISEQHTIYYRNEAGRHIYELEHLVRTTWERGAQLEANVTYLIGEVEKANAYNGTLNEHVLGLRQEAEIKEAQHRVALRSAKSKASARASVSSTRTPSARPPPSASQDNDTLLGHNRATICSLRAEIRDLKASKKEVQDRLLELGSAPAVDGRAFFQNAGVPREVLNDWSQVLLGKDREVAALCVRLDREREAR
jgi:hypothetical protein